VRSPPTTDVCALTADDVSSRAKLQTTLSASPPRGGVYSADRSPPSLLALAPASTGVVFGGRRGPADAMATTGQATVRPVTPDTPGAVGATVRYDVPSRVTGLTVTAPAGATVVSTSGLTRASESRYRLDGSTANPAVTLSEPANRSLAGSRAAIARRRRGAS